MSYSEAVKRTISEKRAIVNSENRKDLADIAEHRKAIDVLQAQIDARDAEVILLAGVPEPVPQMIEPEI